MNIITRQIDTEKLLPFLEEHGYQIWRLQKENRYIFLFSKKADKLVFGISVTPSSAFLDVGVLSETEYIGDIVLMCSFFLTKRITKRRLEELAVYLQGESTQPEEHAILTSG